MLWLLVAHTKLVLTVALCLQINPMTVYGMLHEQNIPKGEFLLQTAATSVLGRQMISLAKHYGIQTINIVRREEAVKELKSIGYAFASYTSIVTVVMDIHCYYNLSCSLLRSF